MNKFFKYLGKLALLALVIFLMYQLVIMCDTDKSNFILEKYPHMHRY